MLGSEALSGAVSNMSSDNIDSVKGIDLMHHVGISSPKLASASMSSLSAPKLRESTSPENSHDSDSKSD